MKILRLFFLLFFVAAMFAMAAREDYALPVSNGQKRVARAKPAPVVYVCPMHSNVTSKSPGICHKCDMALVRKRKPKTR